MRRVALALLLVACKQSGPSDEELARQRAAAMKKLCEQPGPRATWEQLAALAKQVKAAPPVKEDKIPLERSFKFRELHFSDGVEATTDVNWLYDFEGPKRGIIGSCVFRQDECKADDYGFEDALKGCGTIDSYVLVRPLEEKRPRVPEGGGSKYEGGSLTGEAFVFVLGGDAGPTQVGAFGFSAKLRGEVEVYRDQPVKDVEYTLNEALRKSALRQLEAMLTR